MASGTEYDAVASPATLDLDTPMYPVTQAAQFVDSDVKPELQNYLQQATLSNLTIDTTWMYMYRRYESIVLYALQIALQIMSMRKALMIKWDNIEPKTPQLPDSLAYARSYWHLAPVDFERFWGPSFARLEKLILPPSLVKRMKRTYTPYFVGEAQRGFVAIPTHIYFATPSTYTAEQLRTLFTNQLDLLSTADGNDDTLMVKVQNVLAQFLPWALADQKILELGEPMVEDRFATLAHINNSFNGFSPAQVTGTAIDPEIDTVVVDNAITILSNSEKVTGEELDRLVITQDITSPFAGHWSLSLDTQFEADVLDDNNVNVVFSGTPVGGSEEERLCQWTMSRFAAGAGHNHGRAINQFDRVPVPVDTCKDVLRVLINEYYDAEFISKAAYNLVYGGGVRPIKPATANAFDS
jgi:hypothetical protein